jgi:CHAT domain-containing protein/Tfp pilus assembly protein PilF
MSGAARILALAVCLAATAPAVDATIADDGPDALAARLLAARADEREPLLALPQYATAEVARALVAAGRKDGPAGADAAKTLDAFRTAEGIARRIGAEREVALALLASVEALGVQGKLAPIPPMLDEARRIYESLGDAAGQAETWNSIGNYKNILGEPGAALEPYEKAFRLWSSAGDEIGGARALNNVGNVHRSLGSLDEALQAYEQALPVFEGHGDRARAAVVTNNVGLVHFERGEYPEALAYCRRSLAMQEALGDPYRVATAAHSVATILRAQGAYARALEVFYRALKIRQEIGDTWGTMETLNNIGEVHFSEGDYRLAIDAYKRALGMNAKMGGDVQLAEGLANIAAAARRLGERTRAVANYRESLRLSQRDGYRGIAARDLHDLGRMALEEGRLSEAKDLLGRALAARETLKDQAGIAESLSGLAALDLAAQRPRDALLRAGRAVEIARAIEQPELRWEAETLSARAYRTLGRADEARRALERAVAVIEELRLQAGGEPSVEGFFEGRLSPYHELLALALARGATAEALEIAERSKARELALLLEKGRADVAGRMTQEERHEERGLQAALVSANRALQGERQEETPDPARVPALETERDTRRRALEAFQTAVYSRHPELPVQRGRAAPFAVAEAAALLPDPSVALLEYVVLDDEAYLFVLAREGGRVRLDAYPLGLGRRALEESARRMRERMAGRDLAFGDDARALYERLLAPARTRLAGKTHLVVVPDGALWEVPFQALRDPAGRYLIESAAVSYAPSLTVLRETLRPRAAREGPPSLLAMGKADFGERQAREIADLYEPARRALYLGPEAREDRFKTEAPRYSILHLAAHGELDEASPLYSHVVLSPGTSGSSEDGLLEAWEMMDLRLTADLLILSACESGRGRIAPGEGIVGTMWAAFVAGSRALLVSQWKVEATSTTELMIAFHRGLAAGTGASKAGLLRQASLEVLRQPRYAHPFYWAGFVLVGNPY